MDSAITLLNSYRRAATEAFRNGKVHLLQPVDGASLAAFRILFGLILAWEVVRYFEHGWIERYYITPTFYFTYPFLDFIKPWPGNGMIIHFAVMGALALLIALGFCYRLATFLFSLAFTYVFLLDKTNYLNHFYLIILLSWLLCILPAHRAFSLDHWLFFRGQAPVVPQWSLFCLRAQLFIVYFYAGLAKVNGDWLRGEPMRMWLAERTDFPLVGNFFTLAWVVFLLAYGGLLFDSTVGFLLVKRKTRPLALALATLFHGFNAQLFQIGIFPWLMLGATTIFAEPEWPRRVVGFAGGRIRVLTARVMATRLMANRPMASKRPVAGASVTPIPLQLQQSSRQTTAVLLFIPVYFALQLLIPLRHFLYPGNVSWTEEGHRFAWHMKLNDKEATLRLYVTDPRSGETWEVSPAVDLSRRQFDQMKTRPDMVAQYTHYLANRLSVPGRPRPIVWANMQVSLNGRPYQPLIDPTVNLAEVSLTSWQPADWIMPLEVPLLAGTLVEIE